MRRSTIAILGGGAVLLAGCGGGASPDEAEVVEVVETSAAPTGGSSAGGDGNVAAARMMWEDVAPNGKEYLAQVEAAYPLDTMPKLDAAIAAATGACLTRGELPVEAAEQAETVTAAAWENLC